MAIAEAVKKLRDGRGWSQKELAERSGVPQKTISNIEQGVSDNPAWKTMTALAEALGVDCTVFHQPRQRSADDQNPRPKRKKS